MRIRALVKSAVAAGAVLVAGATTASPQQGPWTGLYIGLHGGHGWASDTDPSVKGFVGGGHAGYNMQFGQIVAGIEGDISGSGMSATVNDSGVNVKVEVDYLWSIRGRLGFALSNTMLLYGTAGYGGFGVSARASAGGVTVTDDGTASGFVAGGGLEMAFTRNVLGRIEGLYYMGKGNGDLSGTEQDVTVVRAGLSYRF